MIYYTADWHFGHANIIKHSNRPFASAEEMDKALIANYNSVVTNADTVYVLGDVSWCSFEAMKPILQKLKGTKHLILGNHDKGLRNNLEAADCFASISDMLEIRDNGRKVVLCHYPMLSWNGLFKDTVHVFGHIHNNTSDPGFEVLENLNAYNAGVDVNGYMPVTLEQLIENKKRFYEKLYASETASTERKRGSEM
ncbi:MAG: metallophosphoesterase family protein [Clostridiaceae bacterium]|jgi:calcineurin-like phosphoesterase family protein|nr:metallophosphoesterase family protein [Clostridiaceae bacterium]